MTGFTERAARNFLVIKVARVIKTEIEKAGVDNLKILAQAGHSTVGTYLEGCSPPEKTKLRQELGAMARLGVTPEMLLDEFAGQMPELVPIMEGKEEYKSGELEKIASFMKEV